MIVKFLMVHPKIIFAFFDTSLKKLVRNKISRMKINVFLSHVSLCGM